MESENSFFYRIKLLRQKICFAKFMLVNCIGSIPVEDQLWVRKNIDRIHNYNRSVNNDLDSLFKWLPTMF